MVPDYWIKKLVRVERLIPDQEIADILLVWKGFKPAAMIELSYVPRVISSKKIFLRKVSDLQNILRGLSLTYRLHINYPTSAREITRYSYIAKNKQKLKGVVGADNEPDTKQRRLCVGKALGYPPTAVKAFAAGTYLKQSPATITRMPELKFLNFRLSKQWRKELLYVRKKAKAIQKISPELFLRMKK